ncbi:MAG: hypothetical protein JWQ50_1803 [Caballeronia mineralivorans]|jgi:hypothetical protein|nr:hypothetical protein [Caballeronia mineralivorans]MEA3098624.1 hypothetical protein [Caballeronia mineralivorans]
MGRNLVCEWQRVQFQPAVNDNHVHRHVLDKNAVPDYGVPLFSVHRVTVGRPWIDTWLGGVQCINRCKIKYLLFDQIDRKPASLRARRNLIARKHADFRLIRKRTAIANYSSAYGRVPRQCSISYRYSVHGKQGNPKQSRPSGCESDLVIVGQSAGRRSSALPPLCSLEVERNHREMLKGWAAPVDVQ